MEWPQDNRHKLTHNLEVLSSWIGTLKQILSTSNLYTKDFVRFASKQRFLLYSLSASMPELRKVAKSKNDFTVAWEDYATLCLRMISRYCSAISMPRLTTFSWPKTNHTTVEYKTKPEEWLGPILQNSTTYGLSNSSVIKTTTEEVVGHESWIRRNDWLDGECYEALDKKLINLNPSFVEEKQGQSLEPKWDTWKKCVLFPRTFQLLGYNSITRI